MDAKTEYQIVPDFQRGVAAYAVSVLNAIARGETITGETPAQYAQRHLDAMVRDGNLRLLDGGGDGG